MHYIPESAKEFFQEPSDTTVAEDSALADAAVLYLLTFVVGLLLVADATIGWGWLPGYEAWRTPFGYRLALFAAVLGGSRILYHSLDNLAAGRIEADLALTIACLAAILLGEHQTAGLVVFISLVGEAVEIFTLQQAKRAIRKSFDQRPQVAWLIRDNIEREIAAKELQSGDRILIRAGDRIPADGRIEAGSSAVNESPFTGESLPIDKTIGDHVLSGTVNLASTLTVVVERTGSETLLAELEHLVRHAPAKKMHWERTADRFAKWFLPVVFAAAAITLVAWRWQTGTWQAGWLPALGVLVVACPCALILATPCAVMASLAWLAKRGIVVKGSASLERLAEVDVFAFDKTGTLSEGDLSLGEIVALADSSAEEVLRLAASAERPSSHPLAILLRKAAAERKLCMTWPSEFSQHIGAGVKALTPDNRRVLVGSARLMEEQGIDGSQPAVVQLAADGQTPLFVAADGRLIGLIGVRETLRSESVSVLRELRPLGISSFVLLTGDRESPAKAIAKSLAAFDEVISELTPQGKADRIAALQQSGRNVAMIGDGVNDGPALAQANVGIAICRGESALAAEAGDILILGDPLRPLPGLVKLSKALVENIRRSLYWFAIGINIFGILACATGWLSPVAAAVVHEVSSLFVMLNAVRLLWFQDQPATPGARSLRSWQGQLERLAANISPGHWLAHLIHGWRATLQVTTGVLLLAWLASQLILVRADEAVVVLRGGEYLTTLDPGWSWRWPPPFERLIRLKPDAVQSLPLGYRVSSTPDFGQRNDIEWTNAHAQEHLELLPDESQYLTGDGVAVELTADVQYRIADVRKFALASSQKSESLLRSAAESSLRSAIAAESLDNVLTERRGEIEAACLADLMQRIADYDLGLEIVAFHWLEVHPPRPVVDAYRKVSDAWEQREQAVNEAHALATRTLFHTAGEPAIRQLDGQQDSASQPLSLSDWSLSDDDWRALIQPQDDGSRKLSGTAGAVLLEAEAAAEEQRQSARGQADRLRLLLASAHAEPQLSRQHFYWQAVLEALAGKAFTLVDPALSGRRTLYLGEWPKQAPLLPIEPPQK